MRPMLWVWAGMLNDHHMGWGRGFKDGISILIKEEPGSSLAPSSM